MNNQNTKPIRIKTITEFHKLRCLSKPKHPLISVVDYSQVKHLPNESATIFDFYSVSIKRGVSKMIYGQQQYDFDEGIMYFIAPNQTFKVEIDEAYKPSGWMLLIHPDFLWNTTLAKTIRQYEYFGYSVNEALWLSEKEEGIISGIIANIQEEYHSNIDKFTKNIIISHLENLLSYSQRFYNRQFITREKANHQILERLEELLNHHFNDDDLISKGLPTVQYVAGKLNVSSSYLSSLLRMLTGQNTQQLIHEKLIEKAKEKLSTTDFSVSEIAYELGFEHPQSFSKFFKMKTSQSPLDFRASFN
ncbi:transcriptional regulator, AraC family [Chitinophaga costaii]|uniref:Transcriptional regulator, AraC family n=1 Tax=Chitinophaga costaii TaxID=1335309 RepID=A0A1C3YR34_9BACT|nr:helix-turn-helix domain-containing protein [Chitinophaga costaii]PUZ30066.1 AraC family transcriptional regulator [Chitinophaga costaii]SCB72551.1 transcriptional regulator, AraC family [Chitinophaga costaii]